MLRMCTRTIYYSVCGREQTSMGSRDDLRQWLHAEFKVTFANGSNIQQHEDFQGKCFEPKVKLNTSAHIVHHWSMVTAPTICNFNDLSNDKITP